MTSSPCGRIETLGSDVSSTNFVDFAFPSQLRSGFGCDNATRIVKLASLRGCNYVSRVGGGAFHTLASVRRSNCTCRFPAYSFHEGARERERVPSEGISETRFTKPNSS